MKNQKFLLSFFIILYLEIVYHLLTFKVFLVKDIFYLVIFTLFISLFVDLITSLFSHKNNKLSFIGVILFLNILFISQYVNYLFYGNIISIYSLFNGSQVFGYFSQIFNVILNNFFGILLFLVPSILVITFKNKIQTIDFEYRTITNKAIVMVLLYLVSISTLFLSNDSIYSVKNLYFNRHAPNQTAKAVGLMTTMRLDLFRILSNFEESVEFEKPVIEVPKEVLYNKLDINFDELIENENNSVIKNIHQYISNTPATNQNDYTGYFKGKNLIYITAEAWSPIAVMEEYTPTLYKLVNEGFKFENFYSPVYYVSTSDGEYVNLTGLLPKETVWSMSRSSGNYMPYNLGNMFKNAGYSTNAFHNGSYKYYDRHKSLPNMGYKYMGCGNGLEKLMNCKPWPQSDLEMINGTFNLYSSEENFMTYYMSISGHLEYNFGGNNMANKNKGLVADLPYSSAIKAYVASQIELDKALEELINKLDNLGILKDTVIAMSTDHYPYGLTIDEMKEVMDIEDNKMDPHKNNFIIWNSEMKEPIITNKHSSSLDILPTLLNLFGFEYDSRLLMGIDIFSDSDSIIMFNDRSWMTKYGKYNINKNSYTEFINTPDGYVDRINNEVYNKYVISKNILETNYYEYVLGDK